MARLIPARAGKTVLVEEDRGLGGAHPRACGENSSSMVKPLRTVGSSPRVRGKPVPLQAQPGFSGLIPARAGKTGPPGAPGRQYRAHPRACGENAVVVAYNKSEAGSSPRVRGKPSS